MARIRSVAAERHEASAVEAHVLNAVPEAALKALLAQASESLDAPISLISQVAGRRSWINVKVGVDAEEMLNDLATRVSAIPSGETMLIENAAQDSRLATLDLILEGVEVRGVAGVPLVASSGKRLGTICAVDTRSRRWTEKQGRTLRRLAEVAAGLLEAHAAAGRLRDHPSAVQATSLRELRYRTVFDAIREGLVLQDRAGAIIEVNPSAARILGLTEDQLLGRTSMDPRWRTIRADGSPFPGEDHPAMVALRTGLPVDDRLMGVELPTGERRWIRVSAQPLFQDDEVTPFQSIATFVDVTDAKRAELALAEDRARLEQVVAGLPAYGAGLTEGDTARTIDLMVTVLRDACRLLVDDTMDAIILMAIWSANTQHMPGRDARQSFDVSTPDSARRPIPNYALSVFIGVPLETVRRRVRRLIERGLCERRVPGGVFLPCRVTSTPSFVEFAARAQQAMDKHHQRLARPSPRGLSRDE